MASGERVTSFGKTMFLTSIPFHNCAASATLNIFTLTSRLCDRVCQLPIFVRVRYEFGAINITVEAVIVLSAVLVVVSVVDGSAVVGSPSRQT